MNITKNFSESLSFWNSSPKSTSAIKAKQTFIWRTVQNTKNNLFGYVIEAVLAPVIMMLIFN
jgi:ABC-2 type transport system permease protein